MGLCAPKARSAGQGTGSGNVLSHRAQNDHSAPSSFHQGVYWFSVNWKKLGWQLMSGCCCFGYVLPP
jgi:hypothetical protein